LNFVSDLKRVLAAKLHSAGPLLRSL